MSTAACIVDVYKRSPKSLKNGNWTSFSWSSHPKCFFSATLVGGEYWLISRDMKFSYHFFCHCENNANKPHSPTHTRRQIMPYLEAASSKPRSLRYMDRELSKYLPKDADFRQTVLGERNKV